MTTARERRIVIAALRHYRRRLLTLRSRELRDGHDAAAAHHLEDAATASRLADAIERQGDR